MKKKKKGFTLIEVVVALGAFMIIMLAITSILMTTIKYTGINKRTFDSNSISRTFFEAMKENRISIPTDPTILEGEFSTGFGDVSTDPDADRDRDNVRDFVTGELLNETVVGPSGVGDPSNFSACKQVGKRYSMGIRMKWTQLSAGTPAKGVYEIETWCWDTNKGESSLVNRKTFLAPK